MRRIEYVNEGDGVAIGVAGLVRCGLGFDCWIGFDIGVFVRPLTIRSKIFPS